MPKTVKTGINIEGIKLEDASITLAGKYNHPRMPYPANWREITPDERQAWRNDFTNSDEYPAYLKKVADAKAQRFQTSAQIAADGSFTFENIKPAWYELNVSIMHPKGNKNAGAEMARAHALRQFFVRDPSKPLNLGNVTLKVKNIILPGDTAPDFSINRYDGTSFKLSELRGKYVLYDFWATWCGPCIGEIPNLESVYKEFGGDRFTTLGLSVDENIDDAAAFLKKTPSHYLQGHIGTEAHYAPISTAYGIQSIPSIWLVDPEGKIIARNLRGKGIKTAVQNALNTANK